MVSNLSLPFVSPEGLSRNASPHVWSIRVGKTRAYMWLAVLYVCVTNKMKEVRWHLRPDNLSGYPCQPLFNSRLYLNPFTPKQSAIFGTAGGLVCFVCVCVCVCVWEVFLETSASIFNLKIYIWDLLLKGFAPSDGRNWFGIECDTQERESGQHWCKCWIKVFSCSQVFQKYIFMSAWSLSDTWKMPEN